MRKRSCLDRELSLKRGTAKRVAAYGALIVALCIEACSAGPNTLHRDGSVSAPHASSREEPARALGSMEPPTTTVGSPTSTDAELSRSGSDISKASPANVTTTDTADTNAASDIVSLRALQQSRSRDGSSYDFAIGPGDVIQVSVPAIEALRDRTVRVSADNTIALPLIGVMTVSGRTEKQIRDALKLRLQQYMFDPQVEVFVKEYRTRQIAISGAVKVPGLYTLASPSDTILQMISRAGGMTEDAAPRIILIPGALAQNTPVPTVESSEDPGSSAPRGLSQEASLSPVLHESRHRESLTDHDGVQNSQELLTSGAQRYLAPVVIDVRNINSQRVLDLPARPGDVVIVPSAGQVMVQGWVQNPGAYKITPGMTALGAVGAAGGAMFSKSAEIVRVGSNGQRVELPIDLSNGSSRKNADLLVQAGDVLIVQRSVTGSVPYFVYSVFNKFGTGMYIPIP